jgi:hypothetical protein
MNDQISATKNKNTNQAIIRLIYDNLSAITGLTYFVHVVAHRTTDVNERRHLFNVSISGMKILLRPSFYTFAESAIRNTIYLWVAHEIVQLGVIYASAWGFSTRSAGVL